MSSSFPTGATKNRRPSMLSPQLVILAVLLVVLAMMFFVAVAPEFRGGGFSTCVLATAIGLVAVVLVRAAAGLGGVARDESDDDVPLKLGEREELAWTHIARAVAIMAGLFAAVVLLGIVIGLTVAAFAILRLHMHVPARNAAVLAFVWGVVVPVVFSKALEVAVWPGLVPELVPRWIGGGVLPPL